MQFGRHRAAPVPVFAYCEPVHATVSSRIHIRRVGPAGLKLGGGIAGEALCGYDVTRGWDLPGLVDAATNVAGVGREHGPQCVPCATAWAAA